MKKGLSILILLCCFSLVACSQKKAIIVKTLGFEYLEGCETGKGECKPIEIYRQNKTDSILLVFPSGGTQSDVYFRSTKGNQVLLHDGKRHGQEKPTLNLTNLDDGEYSANMISCGLGGGCIVRLKTKS